MTVGEIMRGVPEWLGDEERILSEIGILAEQVGFGNAIAHLKREWMVLLMDDGLPEESARLAVLNRDPYPLAFHRPSGLRALSSASANPAVDRGPHGAL